MSGVPALQRALGTAFGIIGVIFFLGGPIIALSRDWGIPTMLVLAAIGLVASVIAMLMLVNASEGA